MTLTINGFGDLRDHAGQHLGYSDWLAIDQSTIDGFAAATGDHQWIHTDPDRARVEGPFGGTIAHGYLTLSLIPRLAPQIYRVEGVAMAINYGLDNARFPAPVPAGGQVRMGAELREATLISPTSIRVRMLFTFAVRDPGSGHESVKPACVAEVLFHYSA
ncbi:MAG: MaoC family dehydratase [Acidimicrobiales bacterium]|nr:MAG: MaoC family dehydratase [Acidimicrobiales bacterium]